MLNLTMFKLVEILVNLLTKQNSPEASRNIPGYAGEAPGKCDQYLSMSTALALGMENALPIYVL